MNKIFKSFILLLGISAAVSACHSPAELVNEIDYSRVLTPLKFEAEVVPSTGTDVTFTWQDMKNADGYLLEVYELPEGTDVIPEEASGSPVISKDVEKGNIPYTVYGLGVDKTFYARVQGCSNVLKASNWAYLVNTFSTSAVRSSLGPIVEERTSTSITVTWNPLTDKKDLTSIRVEPVLPIEGETARTLALTEVEINGCSTTVEGLTPGKEYRFTLLFGKAGKRGSVTGFTRPNTEGTTVVSSAAEILNAIDNQDGTVKLLVENSETPYEFTDIYPVATSKFATIKGEVYIFGKSSEDGTKPVLNGLTFSLAEGATVLHIEDLCIDGQNEGTLCANPKAAMTKVEYVNCEITNFSKAIYSNGSSDTGTVASFLIDGCYIHDINATGSNGGDFIDVRGGANGDFRIQNSTFYAVARTFFRASDKSTINSAVIKNCTFNYVTSTTSSSNNAGIFHVRQTTNATSLQCLNNVFLNQYNDKEDAADASKSWVRMARNSTDSYSPYCSGNVYYHVGAAWWTSSAPGAPNDPNTGLAFSEELGMKDGLMLTDDPCVNSEAGKLYLTSKGAVIVSKGAGDPKWWDAVQPVIIRPTELEVAPDEYTWDFTDKTVYDTEELVANTIIGNTRIYATALVPAQVTMNKGLTLQAASVSPEGIPTYGGIEILTNGYGSVKVTAESTDGFGSVQVIAGGDRYALLADGTEHIVNLGDLRDENSIYVIADQEITLKKVVWTKDLTPEPDRIILKTPTVTVTPSKVKAKSTEDVVISWTEVDNASVYVLTSYDGIITTEKTSYTIPGSDIATLATGDYEFTVVAQPVFTSTKFAESEAGKATLKVEPDAADVVLEWDFSSAVWQNALAEVGAANTDITGWNLTVDGLTFLSPSKSKYNSTFIQMGGKGKTTDRVFIFDAPAAGTLKVWASNTGSSEDMTRMVTVKVDDGAEQSKAAGSVSSVQTETTFEIPAGKVYIYPTGNALRFYKIQFTYKGGAKENYVWDFSTEAWQKLLSPMGEAGKDITATWDITVDGLNFYSTQKNRWNTTYIQAGGGGSETDRVFTFTSKGSGYLYVKSSNTGSSEDLTREICVQIAGDATTKQSKAGGTASGSPITLEFEIGAGVQKIYPSKALRIYSIEFHTDKL